MDKFEYQAKLEEINKLVEKQDYEEAARIADSIEWKRVRSVRTLCMVSEIYEAIGRVEDSKAILYRAYRRSPNSRQILYRLTEVCVQTQDFDDAVEYYTEYVNLSPHDNSKYILKYEIYKGRGSSIEEQIEVLEEYKSKEYTEKWAYELAKLYDEAGMADYCVAECDDLALWFHNGKYVVQALELKQKYAPLTPEQQTIYDNPSEIVDMETKEEVVEKAVPTLDQEIMKEMPSSEKDVIADSIIMSTEREIAAAVAEHKEDKEEQKKDSSAEEKADAEKKPALKSFDTVGLQSELASSMREILAGLKPAPKVEELKMVAEETTAAMEEPVKAAEQPKEEKTAAGQVSLDEPIPAEETLEEEKEPDVMTAETINITESLLKEIGHRSVREYAAAVRAAKKEETKTAEPKSAEAEELQMPKAPKMVEMPKMQAAPIVEPVSVKQTKMVQPQEEKAEELLDEPDEGMPEVTDVEEPVIAAKVPEEPVAQPQMAQRTEQPQQMAQPQMTPQTEQPQQMAQPQMEQPQPAPQVNPTGYVRNGLDEKERAMIGFWSLIRGMNEQIDSAVTHIMKSVLTDKTSGSGNVILMGDAGNGRTTLAVGLAKIISRCKGQKSAKVAKIYAEDFNKKDIAATVSKISGGVLIIEEAGDLDDNAIAQLSMAMDFKTDSLIVVLEDERRYLQELLARNPHFSQKFTITLNVPTLTNDELVEFGRYYAEDEDCVLDESATMALYDCIGNMQSPEQPVAILDVKEVVDKAIKNANKFGLKKMFSSISGKRYDEQDRVIIKGKNFKKIKL